MNTPESVSIAQMRTIVLEKLSPEDLWKLVIDDVILLLLCLYFFFFYLSVVTYISIR